ncbi:uncharacterized protein LOC126654429 isoform X2 [Mercurialis annua]|uniref:uncharacterized protein LOC126654429 isoform X2 n=1 Tax=Mercurialis annua TaxID=3986 RepID=UPI00216075AB|nr:uncharacterized protein LOC126654429 isoform X2 [Mercurialis annua]
MSNAVRFHISNKLSSASFLRSSSSPFHHRFPYHIRLPTKSRHRASLSLHHPTPPLPESAPSTSSDYSYSVGSPPHLSHWKFTQRHITLLSVTVCITAVSATCLFLSAIPTLLAFKRAAESLEKLMDVTREELPHTMAAIRLSGMEISDLTMELSDLGQEITQGVKSSTKAVRIAEERLRGFTNMTSPPPEGTKRAN